MRASLKINYLTAGDTFLNKTKMITIVYLTAAKFPLPTLTSPHPRTCPHAGVTHLKQRRACWRRCSLASDRRGLTSVLDPRAAPHGKIHLDMTRYLGLTYTATATATAHNVLLRRLPREHKLALLAATVVALSARAADDVLELFDTLMTTELLSKAERESANEKLRRYPRCRATRGSWRRR